VKAAFAILFSLLLVMTQSLSVVGGTMVKPASCAHCTCANDCCLSKSSPTPQPSPAAPASSNNTAQSLWLIAFTAQSFILPLAPEGEFSSDYFLASLSKTVPLYQRNCAYLI